MHARRHTYISHPTKESSNNGHNHGHANGDTWTTGDNKQLATTSNNHTSADRCNRGNNPLTYTDAQAHAQAQTQADDCTHPCAEARISHGTEPVLPNMKTVSNKGDP